MKAGDTFLILAEEPTKHLWVIISDPEIDPLNVVYVSLTTLRPKGDRACLVSAGEHPFIQHETCVYYRQPRVDSLARLAALRAKHGIQMKEPLAEPLLRRVRNGAGVSDFIPLFCLRILSEQGLIEADEE